MKIVHAHRSQCAKKIGVSILIISFIFQPLTFAQVQLTSTDQNTQVPVIVVEPDQPVSNSGSTTPADIQSAMPMSPLSLPDSIIAASAVSPPDPADPLLVKTNITQNSVEPNLAVANELTIATLPPAPDTQKPIISEIRTSDVTSSDVNIFWVTNELADMTIEYQAEGSSEINTMSNPDMSITHAAQLKNLKADTTYYFRVKSKDAAGNLASSDNQTGLQPYSVYSFTTLKNEITPNANAVIVPHGKTSADQFVIPLYANGASGRSGQIIGWGISSSLVGTANTQNQFIKAIMVADTNGVPLEQPVIRDLSILGHDDGNYWSSAYGPCGSVEVGNDVHCLTTWDGHPPEHYDGININANGAMLENLRLFFIPGTAIQIKQTGDLANILHDISIMRITNGIDLQGGKFDLENVEITGTKNFDLRVGNGSEASIKNFHGWSGNSGVSLEVLAGGKVYVEGIYSEQAYVGIKLEGDESYVTGMYSWANHIANAEIFGQLNQIEGFTVDTSENGAGFIIGNGTGASGHGTIINDGNMYVANNSVGIRVVTDQVILQNIAVGGYGGTAGRTGVQVEKTINNSTIDLDCAYLDLCLDLNYKGASGLGTGNIIRLRSTGDAKMQMINLPSVWDPSNQIYINGSLIPGSSASMQNPPPSVSIPKIAPLRFNFPTPVKPLTSTEMPNPPSGYLIVQDGTTSISQFMIPRLGDGENHPAGQIMGKSELTSIVSATADTKNQAIKAIIYTQDWGNHLAEIQAGTGQPNYLPALLDPLIRDVTIKGFTGDVSTNVMLDQGKTDLYNGVFFGSDGGQIENVTISGIPGTALTTVRYGAIASGLSSPYDATKPTLRNLTILNSFRGLEVIGADQFLSNISVGNVRDYAVHLVGAAAQVYGVHTFGAGDIGIWFSTGPSWLNGAIETEGQKIGIFIDADQTGGASTSMVNDLYSHDHSDTNVKIKADSAVFHNFKLEVMPDANGFDIGGQRTALDQGTVALEGNNSVGIHMSNIGGWGTTIKNVTITGTGAQGQVGLMLDNPNQWVDPATQIGHDLPLIGADIDVAFSNVETAVNLFPNGRNMIGYNNVIRITILDGDPNQMIKLPPTWDTNSNKIYVNGVLLTSASDLALVPEPAGSTNPVVTPNSNPIPQTPAPDNGSQPTQPNSDVTAPEISSVVTTQITEHSATVSWITNEASESLIEYGTTDQYGINVETSTLLMGHVTTLANLEASTVYHFRIKSKDANGNKTTSQDFTFTTLTPELVASAQSITIDPRDKIGINYGFGGNTVPVVYDEGDPNNPYDDISNAMMGWGVLEEGWAPTIERFENAVAGGVQNISIIALFGRPGLYNKDLANFIGEPTPDGFVDFAPGYYDMPLTSWHYLNGRYREWYINKYGQEPPVITTFNLWKAFNESHPDVKIALDFGSPHNDYDLRELAARLEREGNSDPFHAQEYWDYLWSALEPVFRVGFKNLVMDNSSGNAQYPATRRMLEVLTDPSKRDCAGLDHLLCGEGAPIQASEKVNVIVEAKPMLGDDYIYQMDYWGDNRYLTAFQHAGFDPVHFGPDDLYSGTAWRYIWWYFNGTHPDVNDLYQTASNILADGDIALIQDLVQTGSTKQYTQYAGFQTVKEFLQNLNVSSIPVKIDLRSGNGNEDNLNYIITDPPKDQNGTAIGTLVQNTYYPYIYKFIPDPGFSGTVTFKYKVSDGTHESEEATVTIDVKPIKPVDSESNHPSPVQVENPNPIADPITPVAVLSPFTSNSVEPVVVNDLSIPIPQEPTTNTKEANSAPLSTAQIATKRELIQPWIETKELEGNKPSKSKEDTDIFAFIKNKKERAESRRTAKRMGLNKNRKVSSKEFLVFWPSLKAALQTQDLDSIARYDVNGDGKLDQEDINFFIKTAGTSK